MSFDNGGTLHGFHGAIARIAGFLETITRREPVRRVRNPPAVQRLATQRIVAFQPILAPPRRARQADVRLDMTPILDRPPPRVATLVPRAPEATDAAMESLFG